MLATIIRKAPLEAKILMGICAIPSTMAVSYGFFTLANHPDIAIASKGGNGAFPNLQRTVHDNSYFWNKGAYDKYADAYKQRHASD